jgi:hypothetical protein
MTRGLVNQFASMLDQRFGLGHKSLVALKPKKSIRETITYPKVSVTGDTDSCLNETLSYEHVLACGHLITTALPNEPCAPNCHHVADGSGKLDYWQRNNKVPKTKHSKTVSEKAFYCDACRETIREDVIGADLSSTAAEKRRATLRAIDAKAHQKDTMFRKCYIALKVTSVPCHSDGMLSSRYAPREEHHVFDIALPQSGENMFEDVDPNVVNIEKECADMTKAKSTTVVHVNDLDTPDENAVPSAGHTYNTATRLSHKSAVNHNDQAAYHSKAPKKRQTQKLRIPEDEEEEGAQLGFRAPKRRRIEEPEDCSEEDGEIVEQPTKRRRVAPVARTTRSATRKQSKRT